MFSEKWSLNLSIIGILLTLYRSYNKYSPSAIFIAIFYTIMELTQYFQYKVINQCDNKINQNLTKFTWFLEWVQPVMWNIIYYYRSDSNKDVFKCTIVLSLIVSITGLLRVFNTSKNKSVTHELQVNGRNCTLQGKNHLLWNNNAQTFYGYEPNWFACLLLWFIPMLWITPFKVGLLTFFYHFIGLFVSYLILGRKFNDELNSTWCLISIPGILIDEFI